jgi:hypothetical protein
VSAVLAKLGTPTRAEASAEAARRGLVGTRSDLSAGGHNVPHENTHDVRLVDRAVKAFTAQIV